MLNQPYGHIIRMEGVLNMMDKKVQGDQRREEARQRAEAKANALNPNTEIDLAKE